MPTTPDEPITPDEKDWTWVLERPCPECGFDADEIAREDVARLVRDTAESWREILTRSDRLRERPSDDRWSALEYACHVRDVFRRYDFRLGLMRTQDDPMFPNWDQDATAVADRYAEQDPETVARELDEATQRLADNFDGVTPEEWSRTGNRSDGARFTIASFARYMIHDPIHHLHDVAIGFRT